MDNEQVRISLGIRKIKRRFRKMNARKNFTKRRFIFLKQPFITASL